MTAFGFRQNNPVVCRPGQVCWPLVVAVARRGGQLRWGGETRRSRAKTAQVY